MSAARDRLDAIERDSRAGLGVAIADDEFIFAALRRALDALESSARDVGTPEASSARRTLDAINALAAGKEGGV